MKPYEHFTIKVTTIMEVEVNVTASEWPQHRIDTYNIEHGTEIKSLEDIAREVAIQSCVWDKNLYGSTCEIVDDETAAEIKAE